MSSSDPLDPLPIDLGFEPTESPDLTFSPTTTYPPTVPSTFSPTTTYPPTVPFDDTDQPTRTKFPTYAPTMTHAPTTWDTTASPVDDSELTLVTLPPVPAPVPLMVVTEAPTQEDSVEDSMSATPPVASFSKTVKPTAIPTAKPTLRPTAKPTSMPTNPVVAIKQGKYRNKSVGFQSEWGPAHPGSMIYDFTRNSIYMTGTTFAPNKLEETKPVDFARSSCFVGELNIADVENWTVDDPPKPVGAERNKNFVVPDSFGAKQQMSCHIIHKDKDSITNDRLYVGGVSELRSATRNAEIEPVMNTYERNRNFPNRQLNPTPFSITKKEGHIKWPVVMTSGGLIGKKESVSDVVLVLSVSSEDTLMTEEYIENGGAKNPKNFRNTLLPPGLNGGDPSKYAVPKRGTQFYLSYQEYIQDSTGGLTLSMEGNILTRGPGDIFPTGVGNLRPGYRDYMFAGSMRGSFPAGFSFLDGAPKTSMDYDGFVVGYENLSLTRNRNVRFHSIENDPPLDDFVHGICMPPPAPDGTIKAFYVVGSTYGTMPPSDDQTETTTNILSGLADELDGNKVNRLSAWVSKISTSKKNRRSILWTTQLFATNDNLSLEGGMTEAFGCDVIDMDKTKMYVGGTVYNGGIMDSSQKSGGSDDVWVAQLNTKDGSMNWIKQIGSSGDEKLARTNGIESDVNGHAIIYGETTGELYRKRKSDEIFPTDDGSSTDIFVTTLDMLTGETESTIESDRAFEAMRKGIMTAGIVAALLLLCACCGMIAKWRRAQRYAAKDTDGIVTDGAFRDGDGDHSSEENEMTFSKTHPPQEAFKDDNDKNFII